MVNEINEYIHTYLGSPLPGRKLTVKEKGRSFLLISRRSILDHLLCVVCVLLEKEILHCRCSFYTGKKNFTYGSSEICSCLFQFYLPRSVLENGGAMDLLSHIFLFEVVLSKPLLLKIRMLLSLFTERLDFRHCFCADACMHSYWGMLIVTAF